MLNFYERSGVRAQRNRQPRTGTLRVSGGNAYACCRSPHGWM